MGNALVWFPVVRSELSVAPMILILPESCIFEPQFRFKSVRYAQEIGMRSNQEVRSSLSGARWQRDIKLHVICILLPESSMWLDCSWEWWSIDIKNSSGFITEPWCTSTVASNPSPINAICGNANAWAQLMSVCKCGLCLYSATDRELHLYDKTVTVTPKLQVSRFIVKQAGRRLVRSLLTLRVFVVDVMDLRTGNRNEDDS